MSIVKVGNNEYWSLYGNPSIDGPDGQGLIDCNCEWNICISARDIGKSYTGKMYAINEWLKTGHSTGFIKRYDNEIKTDFMDSYWADMIPYLNKECKKRFPEYDTFGVKAWRGDWTVVGFRDNSLESDKLGILGHAFAVNQSGKYKSQAYPDMYSVIMEEFIPENHITIPDEFDRLLSIISTIRRDKKNFKIFLWANAIDPNCDYFEEMNIDPKDLKQGEIKCYNYYDIDPQTGEQIKNTLAIEWVRPLLKEGASRAWATFNRKQEQMLYHGTWQTKGYRTFKDYELFDRVKPQLSLILDHKFIHLYAYVFETKGDDTITMIVTKKRLTNKVDYITMFDGQTNLKTRRLNWKSKIKAAQRIRKLLLSVYMDDLLYFDNDLTGLDFERLCETYFTRI